MNLKISRSSGGTNSERSSLGETLDEGSLDDKYLEKSHERMSSKMSDAKKRLSAVIDRSFEIRETHAWSQLKEYY